MGCWHFHIGTYAPGRVDDNRSGVPPPSSIDLSISLRVSMHGDVAVSVNIVYRCNDAAIVTYASIFIPGLMSCIGE